MIVIGGVKREKGIGFYRKPKYTINDNMMNVFRFKQSV